jgi:hypothetical protein
MVVAFDDFMDTLKKEDEWYTQDQSEVQTKDYFTDNFNNHWFQQDQNENHKNEFAS